MNGTTQSYETNWHSNGDLENNPMSTFNPKHYDIEIRGHKFQAVDLIEALFPQDAHMSQACKYMVRAGRKAESSYLKDVGKCLWWCAKAIMFHGGHVELPEGAIPTRKKPKRERPDRSTGSR